jgi:MFS family permease|tara:strand:- start:5198 stop:6475 length:1278 start_codon:yes stop_codon:yes gene_type:complete
MGYTWYKDRSFLAIILIETYTAYAAGINAVSSPYLADDFALSQADVAAMFAFFSLGLLGTMYFSRVGDIIGRKRIILISVVMLWLLSLLSIYVTNYLAYVGLQIVVAFSAGTIFATCPVFITEHVPEEYRARAQSIAAFMSFSGGGWVIILMPLYAATDLGWRMHWVYLAASLPVAIIYTFFVLVETEHFLKQVETDERAEWKALLKARYTIPLLCSAFLNVLATAAGSAYFYYYLITLRGLSQTFVSTVSIAAGCIGMAGFVIAARAVDRFGRVPCVSIATIVLAGAMLCLYANWGEGRIFIVVMFLSYSILLIAITARDVILRVLSTELYPTHLRSTYAGVLALVVAVAVVLSHVCATFLIQLTGRLEYAVMMMMMLTIPALLLFLLVPETKDKDINAPDWQNQGTRLIDRIRGRVITGRAER